MKYDLIAEAYVTLLIEGRIDDLKEQNPHLINEIDSYANQDPTPQKKFVPWLVSQHKKGNVTPDEPSLSNTLSGFETYKSQHRIKDHSSKSYQEIKNAVQPFIGTAATKNELKKQQIHNGIEQIYSSDDGKIQVFHVKTKEASQHVYGGGKELGGLHTDWCISARSDNCMFGTRGPVYTIHNLNDNKSPYAVHPDERNNKITSRFNDGDINIDEFLKEKPELKIATEIIKKHHNDKINRLQSEHDLSNQEIHDVIVNGKDLYGKYLIKNPNSNIGMSILNDPSVYKSMIDDIASRHPNAKVALTALNHPLADWGTVRRASQHEDSEVVLASLNHPLATAGSISNAVRHPNAKVALTALNHPLADMTTAHEAVRHPDAKVALAGLKHPLATEWTTLQAAMNQDPTIALAALNHPLADIKTAEAAKYHENEKVRETAETKLKKLQSKK